MRKAQVLVSALLLILLLVACAPKAAPAPAPQSPAPAAAPAPAPVAVPSAPVKPAWQEEWGNTLEVARREGRLSLLFTGGSEMRTALGAGFKAAYGILVETVSGKGAQLTAKVLAERRAGLYLQDVYLGGSVSPLTDLKPARVLDPLPPLLILPDVTDPELIKKMWYEGRLYWADKDYILLATALNVSPPLAINTNLVKEGEIKSWRDLLNSKWQGKILLDDPGSGGAVENFLLLVDEILGWDYYEKLVKTKPVVIGDQQLMMVWLAQGKVAMVVPPKPDLPPQFVKLGAPVRSLVPEEGTWMSGGSANVAVFNKPAHPNATKVFVNWLLTKEGSTVLSKAGSMHMLRLDVSTDHLSPDEVRDPKMKYVVALSEEIALKKKVLVGKAKEVMATFSGK